MKLVLFGNVIVAFCVFVVLCFAKDSGQRELHGKRIVENGLRKTKINYRGAKYEQAIESKAGQKMGRLKKRQADDSFVNEEEWQEHQAVYASPPRSSGITGTQVTLVVVIVILVCLIFMVGGFLYYVMTHTEEPDIEKLVGSQQQPMMNFQSQATLGEEVDDVQTPIYGDEVPIYYDTSLINSLPSSSITPAADDINLSPGGGSLYEQLSMTLASQGSVQNAPP